MTTCEMLKVYNLKLYKFKFKSLVVIINLIQMSSSMRFKNETLHILVVGCKEQYFLPVGYKTKLVILHL